MKLADGVDLRVVAQRTPGFVGADLANIANEAAIRAVRHDHTTVTMSDFEEAIDRVICRPGEKASGHEHRGKAARGISRVRPYAGCDDRSDRCLERASEIARSMVTQLGMSIKLGPITYERRRQLAFLGVAGEEERNYSEDTAHIIAAEVHGLVEEAHLRAREILSERRPALDALAAALQEHEVMERSAIEQLLREDTAVAPAPRVDAA
jgi:cell division protease FtsH